MLIATVGTSLIDPTLQNLRPSRKLNAVPRWPISVRLLRQRPTVGTPNSIVDYQICIFQGKTLLISDMSGKSVMLPSYPKNRSCQFPGKRLKQMKQQPDLLTAAVEQPSVSGHELADDS